MQRLSGADVLPLQPPRLAVGGTLAVVGFLQLAMGLGHDESPLWQIETTNYKPFPADCLPTICPANKRLTVGD